MKIWWRHAGLLCDGNEFFFEYAALQNRSEYQIAYATLYGFCIDCILFQREGTLNTICFFFCQLFIFDEYVVPSFLYMVLVQRPKLRLLVTVTFFYDGNIILFSFSLFIHNFFFCSVHRMCQTTVSPNARTTFHRTESKYINMNKKIEK